MHCLNSELSMPPALCSRGSIFLTIVISHFFGEFRKQKRKVVFCSIPCIPKYATAVYAARGTESSYSQLYFSDAWEEDMGTGQLCPEHK